MFGCRLLAPADEDVDEVSGAHHSRYAELELEKVRIAHNATLADVADPQKTHRAQDEKEDTWDDFDAKFHDSKHCVVSARADCVIASELNYA